MLAAKEDKINTSDAQPWNCGSGDATDQIFPSLRTQELLEQHRNWKLTLGYEGCYWWTKIHRETEGEPPALRRA